MDKDTADRLIPLVERESPKVELVLREYQKLAMDFGNQFSDPSLRNAMKQLLFCNAAAFFIARCFDGTQENKHDLVLKELLAHAYRYIDLNKGK